ncbi:acyl carrier protein [Geobacter sp. SVR]|uniref:acyl carrier protein n=1 Tax=Geobacter sp. SVR TaxID=2495594 RepID=UPI00143EF9D8|nr:acyl carrier protein [Geobacter sp. SVR]BCS52413.1 acyl carrier protein [Geobacter sp. SVR]GCF87356.1 acyl carrier protein [Geobacter sp. SVR]
MVTLDMLDPIFREVFDDTAITLQRGTTADDIEAWDSLTHMNLVIALELAFKVKFALGELQQLKNVGDMLDLINKKLAK